MKKKLIIYLRYAVALLIVAYVAFIFADKFATPFIRYFTASVVFENRIYNGNSYETASYIFDIHRTKWVGKDDRGNFTYTLKGDPDANFIVSINDNTDTYIKKGYVIPKSGIVTTVFGEAGFIKTTNQKQIDAFVEITKLKGETYEFYVDNIYAFTSEFCFAYNNCPVALDVSDYIAYVDNKWLYISAQKMSYYLSNLCEFKGEGVIIEDKALIDAIKKASGVFVPSSYKN